MPFFRVFLGFSCIILAAAAQTRPGVIAGVVVDRTHNNPLRRAIVTLSTVEAHPQDAVAWTDNAGRFSFSYLPAGRYELRVAKSGYQTAAYGSDTARHPPTIIDLAAGESRSDIVFRLQLITTISGMVVDEEGDPLSGVQVSAMRFGWQRGKRQLLPGPAAVSDGSGHYRITGIPPGRYTLAATSSNRGAVRARPEVAAGQDLPRYSYGTQYYPGTDRPDAAGQITVEAGQEYARLDFHLVAHPTVSVDGRVTLPSGVPLAEGVRVSVLDDRGGNRIRAGAGGSPPDYTFHLDQLLPGSYTLVAQANANGKPFRGVQTIDVPPGGLRDVAIAVDGGVDLSGSVAVEGPNAAKFSVASVTLVPGDGLPAVGPQLRGAVSKDGTFKIADVLPGIWDINVSPIPPGGYIKSMYLGNQDVLTEEMVIGSSTSAPLKIVVSTQAAMVQGDVTAEGAPARGVVVLAPEPRLRHVFSFYRTAVTDEKGHFEIKNAVPGNYKLFAFPELDPQQSFQDPEFLKPFEDKGTVLSLREGENPAQKITMPPDPGGVR